MLVLAAIVLSNNLRAYSKKKKKATTKELTFYSGICRASVLLQAVGQAQVHWTVDILGSRLKCQPLCRTCSSHGASRSVSNSCVLHVSFIFSPIAFYLCASFQVVSLDLFQLIYSHVSSL